MEWGEIMPSKTKFLHDQDNKVGNWGIKTAILGKILTIIVQVL